MIFSTHSYNPGKLSTARYILGFEEVKCRLTTAVATRRKYEVEFSWIPSINDSSPMLS
ncbi:hypothetical protein HanRHA438_Chr06g0266541 [Helianthus annuus]|uniref:Uncharacterized protein n=1 Tax=Helianthus annuus TaxID=4232 RepID=A0A9K3IT89_HELAN|nr:hypothetical protein HanXRQr2_Chr06g0257351 [Helianthus annuus]KAJ0573427.1 hypothetical protein HanHA89_Chr06g0226641 [Helianthus annuus]KAJ0740692.1 hypothetical protein HanOQP8_Chr06g0219631 [Helianthus annuus]KAJ0911741.1 hypothetical protein HanRHA438_Chr06g0266541 [Helianthus annuus]KAJ0915302.1 hypothetical protein HanPSC8_Chr06g0248341 [Helianthus annuus]